MASDADILAAWEALSSHAKPDPMAIASALGFTFDYVSPSELTEIEHLTSSGMSSEDIYNLEVHKRDAAIPHID